MDYEELMNLCACALMDGVTERREITLDEARATLEAWAEEGGELAEGTRDLEPEILMEAWNFCVDLMEIA